LGDEHPGRAADPFSVRLTSERLRLPRFVHLLGALLLAACALAAPAAASPGLLVGADDDAFQWTPGAAGSAARGLGLGAARVTVQWRHGESALAAADETTLAHAASMRGLRLVVAVYPHAGAAPTDPGSVEQFCGFAASVLRRFPSVHDVVIGNEPNSQTFWQPQFNPDGTSAAPASYEALLARCYDVLHLTRSSVNVIGLDLASNGNDNPSARTNVSHAPATFIRLLGEAYRASGRDRPLFDTVGFDPYGRTSAESPFRQHPDGSTLIGEDDLSRLTASLAAAFRGTAQPLPGECSSSGRCVSIWYMEDGFQTTVDPGKAGLYTGAETDRSTVPPVAADTPNPQVDQATQVRDALRLAYCQPYVGAVFNFMLFDETRLSGWQSGLYWADGTPKPSASAFRRTVSEINAREVDCQALDDGASTPAARPVASAPATELAVRTTIKRQPASLTSLQIDYAGSATTAPVELTLSVYNWTSSAWVTIAGPRPAAADSSFTFTSGTPADYVSPTGRVDVRLRASSKVSFAPADELIHVTAS
jgi:hypothetical protein